MPPETGNPFRQAMALCMGHTLHGVRHFGRWMWSFLELGSSIYASTTIGCGFWGILGCDFCAKNFLPPFALACPVPVTLAHNISNNGRARVHLGSCSNT